MALSGLGIYKLLPKTNCKDCGFPTCLAFAMQLAAKKVALDKCPHVSETAKKSLESAAEPPIKLITVGVGEAKLEVGNETVMFRHEEKFYHPTGIGFSIEDTLSEDDMKKSIDEIKKLNFERVGQKIEVNLISVLCKSGDGNKFANAVKLVLAASDLPLALVTDDAQVMKIGLEETKGKAPLICRATKENFKEMAGLSKEYKAPLVVSAPSLEELEALIKNVNTEGVRDLVLDTGKKGLPEKIWDFTQMRKLALKKSFRTFGYPVIAFVESTNPLEEAIEATTYVAKYASIVVMKGRNPWQVLPILTARQNIYTDPQKPLQVEPKIYEIGQVTDKSPVLITTNFSLTYYTVEGEVESSKVPAFIVTCDSEGMSVLTAWAADKFTAETIAQSFEKLGLKDKVKHNEVILPGYVSVLSGKLEEESGKKVIVGPREASGIPVFLRNLSK
ncbi:MAG: acetyl-CoA decarbonylase/synthase complex subunit gamma [Candidatus Omnitrophica bacterium]|nr:acetyl-CoA decarbonylase/synthase complex subunit gamma [Candidatus Omnitrophota bacterium]